jgi:hypothetical protein
VATSICSTNSRACASRSTRSGSSSLTSVRT